MNSKLKNTRLAKYLISHGISYTSRKGERRKKKIVRQMEKSGRISKTGRIITVRKEKGAKFFLPNYERDIVQREIVMSDDYYEGDWLDALFSKIKADNKGAALDIGANIGSHSLYFAKELGFNRIYAFEPIKSTFAILKRNIEINSYMDRLKAFNVGIGDREYTTSVCKTVKNNSGATVLDKSDDENGDILIKAVDSYGFENVTLIKIDTEGYEVGVLRGACKTINIYKPIILVEVDSDNVDEVKKMMSEWHYELFKKSGENCVYIPVSN